MTALHSILSLKGKKTSSEENKKERSACLILNVKVHLLYCSIENHCLHSSIYGHKEERERERKKACYDPFKTTWQSMSGRRSAPKLSEIQQLHEWRTQLHWLLNGGEQQSQGTLLVPDTTVLYVSVRVYYMLYSLFRLCLHDNDIAKHLSFSCAFTHTVSARISKNTVLWMPGQYLALSSC